MASLLLCGCHSSPISLSLSGSGSDGEAHRDSSMGGQIQGSLIFRKESFTDI